MQKKFRSSEKHLHDKDTNTNLLDNHTAKRNHANKEFISDKELLSLVKKDLLMNGLKKSTKSHNKKSKHDIGIILSANELNNRNRKENFSNYDKIMLNITPDKDSIQKKSYELKTKAKAGGEKERYGSNKKRLSVNKGSTRNFMSVGNVIDTVNLNLNMPFGNNNRIESEKNLTGSKKTSGDCDKGNNKDKEPVNIYATYDKAGIHLNTHSSEKLAQSGKDSKKGSGQIQINLCRNHNDKLGTGNRKFNPKCCKTPRPISNKNNKAHSRLNTGKSTDDQVQVSQSLMKKHNHHKDTKDKDLTRNPNNRSKTILNASKRGEDARKLLKKHKRNGRSLDKAMIRSTYDSKDIQMSNPPGLHLPVGSSSEFKPEMSVITPKYKPLSKTISKSTFFPLDKS